LTSDSKKEMENRYKPLIEWIRGNPKVDDNMKKELFDIVHDMLISTINSCYKNSIETLGRRK